MKIIHGKKALVTGAASGIGRAIAVALAEAGAGLYLVDIDEAGLERTGRGSACVACDARGRGGILGQLSHKHVPDSDLVPVDRALRGSR